MEERWLTKRLFLMLKVSSRSEEPYVRWREWETKVQHNLELPPVLPPRFCGERSSMVGKKGCPLASRIKKIMQKGTSGSLEVHVSPSGS